MSNLAIVTPDFVIESPTEAKLKFMKKLKQQIEALQAQYDTLKDQVIATHFAYHDVYRTEDGILLASYTVEPYTYFDKKAFEKKHPRICSRFEQTKEKCVFRLK